MRRRKNEQNRDTISKCHGKPLNHSLGRIPSLPSGFSPNLAVPPNPRPTAGRVSSRARPLLSQHLLAQEKPWQRFWSASTPSCDNLSPGNPWPALKLFTLAPSKPFPTTFRKISMHH